jgi:hypothetical protein
MRRFTQNSNYGFLEFPYNHTAFESHCSVAPSYLFPIFFQDLVVAGRIGDVENNYQLLADLGMQALLSIYCAKGKDFDQVFFKKELKDLGFHRFFATKVFTQLEIWRNALPEDITDDEMKGQWSTYRSLPESEMLLAQRYVLL